MRRPPQSHRPCRPSWPTTPGCQRTHITSADLYPRHSRRERSHLRPPFPAADARASPNCIKRWSDTQIESNPACSAIWARASTFAQRGTRPSPPSIHGVRKSPTFNGGAAPFMSLPQHLAPRSPDRRRCLAGSARTPAPSPIVQPPSTNVTDPVIYAARSDARYATTSATSSGRPNLPRSVLPDA